MISTSYLALHYFLMALDQGSRYGFPQPTANQQLCLSQENKAIPLSRPARKREGFQQPYPHEKHSKKQD